MKFFNRTGLSYVSCSPFRFAIFKLALAQAALEELGLACGEIDLLVGGKELIFPAPAYQQDLFFAHVGVVQRVNPGIWGKFKSPDGSQNFIQSAHCE